MSIKKSIGPNLTLSRKLNSERYSKTTKTLIFSESQRVTEQPVSSRDGELKSFLERLTEVSEKSLVLDLGIQPQSSGLAPELVNMVISTEPNSTTRSTESDQEKLTEPRTTLTARMT